MKPNFLIIGAPNSGSTSLWYYLRQHPEIYMPEIKEPRFFTSKDMDKKWEWYKSLFKNVQGEKAVGEASVSYSETHIWPDVPKKIADCLPDVKIIYIVRDPIKRLESCWKQALSSGHWLRSFYTNKLMPLDFNEAVINYPHLVGTCRYWKHLNEYRKYLKDKKILLLFFEDFVENPYLELRKCFRFLEVDENIEFNNYLVSKNAASEKMMYRPGVAKFLKITGAGKVQKLLPKKVSNFFQNSFLIKKGIPEEVQWELETKKFVINELSNEVYSILEYGGKPLNFWNTYYYALNSLKLQY